MKKYIIIAGLVCASTIVKSQPPNPEERLKHTKEVIQQEVNPAADQLKKIEGVYKIFFESMDKLRQKNPPPPPPPPSAKEKEAMDKLVKERDEQVKKILTADQYKKYQEAAKKFHPPQRDKNGPPPSNSLH